MTFGLLGFRLEVRELDEKALKEDALGDDGLRRMVGLQINKRTRQSAFVYSE